MSVKCSYFGRTKNGEDILLFHIENKFGAYVNILNRGGVIQSLCVPNSAGELTDVVLGFDSVSEYEDDPEYLGAIVGRVANRIEDSRFTLNGETYELFPMEFGNSLHGGKVGYSFRIWENKIEDDRVSLMLHSPDGEEGYPGNLDVRVSYSFSDDCILKIEYEAVGDADTIVNLTNHAYFNLDGSGKIENQFLSINADRFTEISSQMLPTGRYIDVENTPFDFRNPKQIGRDINADSEQLKNGLGYDHNFILNRGDGCVYAYSEKTGIKMKLSTDFPCVLLYSGNSLPERTGKGGIMMPVRAGFCLETQLYPDAPHHPEFPSIVLKAGEVWKHTAEFEFSAK